MGFDRLDLATIPQFEVSDGADENCEVWALTAQSRVGTQVGNAQATSKAKPPRQESETATGDTGCGGGFASSDGAYTVSGGLQLTDDSRRHRDEVEVPAGARNGRGKQGSLGASGKVHIAVHHQIGPYDYVVVDSKHPAALTQWLTTEGNAVPKVAGVLVADHVAKGDVFLAVPLSNPKAGRKSSRSRWRWTTPKRACRARAGDVEAAVQWCERAVGLGLGAGFERKAEGLRRGL